MGPELLAMRAAAVGGPLGSGFLGRELGLGLHEVADHFLASTSRSVIFMSFPTSHLSSVSSQLMINRISKGNLLIKIEVSRPPQESAVTPSASHVCFHCVIQLLECSEVVMRINSW